MSNSSVLIFMTTYNGEKYLRNQLDSLLNQTYTNFHLVIQDDCSTDRTMTILKEYQNKDNRIEILVHYAERHGAYYNFIDLTNIFKNRELYDYYMFCDQDDIWDLNKIETFVSLMEDKDKDRCVLVYADQRLIDENNKVIAESLRELNGDAYVSKYSVFFCPGMNGCNMIMNRTNFLAVPYIDTDRNIISIIAHDGVYARFAAVLGNVYYYKNIVTMSYRRHQDNVTLKANYGFKISRIAKRALDLECLSRDHARLYSQSLFSIGLLKEIDMEYNIDIIELENAIRNGGIKGLMYMYRYKIRLGKRIKDISHQLVLLLSKYKKYLIA